MTPFLKQVAQHYYTDGNPGRLCFVFPNKRAALFFKKYLKESARESGVTLMAPRTVTINEFFYSLTGSVLSDRIELLVTLYDCYKKLIPGCEPLDDFLYWGGVILSDFDDIDKYLADPAKLLRNIAELKGMQDDFSWLDEGQKEAVRHFLGLFAKESVYKEEFRKIWDILLPLYNDFNKTLKEKGLCYEGMVYRSLADSLDENPIVDICAQKFKGTGRFVFAGLNALNNCERKLLSKMRDAGIAEFCWDYSSEEIKDPANRSSHFLGEFASIFPQAFKPDPEGLGKPSVNVLSLSSSIGQAKLLPGILNTLGGTPGIETAIVLPDESMLLPVLNSIPENIEEINVTMGYPIRGSEFLSFMEDLAKLQMQMREKDGEVRFYHKIVRGIFSNGVFRKCVGESDNKCVAAILKSTPCYVPESSFRDGEFCRLVFRNAGTDVAGYQKEIVKAMAAKLGDSIELEFAMTWYKTLNRLGDLKLDIKPQTWYRLLLQIASGIAVPFKGEPLAGLQIMGPLETRALDFKNLVILSFNEGIFPRRNVASSFIPAEIRKGFGLPTYEHQDAVWAYYFYRLVQRAENVWLVCDSRTDLARSGEESRFLKQLELLYGYKPKRYIMKSDIQFGVSTEQPPIPKSEKDVAKLHEPDFNLSVTSLQDYLSCPAMYYYKYIQELSGGKDVAETMDTGTIGTSVHNTMCSLYSNCSRERHPKAMSAISKDYIRALLDEKDKRVEETVDWAISEAMHGIDIAGKILVQRELVLEYVREILRTDLKLLGDSDSFSLLGVEIPCKWTFCGFKFKGSVDRLDRFGDGPVRIVDYKTGKVLPEDVLIDAGNAAEVVDRLFGESNQNRPKIALQLYLYGQYLKGNSLVAGKSVENCIYQTSELFTVGPLRAPVCPEFEELAEERLKGLLAELENPEGEWKRCEDAIPCKWCDFKTICGR